jgi:cyclic pyranopterin phosphate synthase
MRDFNEDEIPEFCELTKDNTITVRFIELMPFDAHQIWKTGHFFGVELMRKQINELYPDRLTAEGSSTEEHVFRIPGYKGKIALIPSYTRTLCGDCSRIRLTADGKIRNCLYSEEEFNVLPLLRNGASDDEIVQFFREAMWKKVSDGWKAQKEPRIKHRSSMTQIGG